MASWRSSPSGGAADTASGHHYRIVVVASTVGTLVESAGGYLCDRAREGWDIAALLREPCDVRPLAVLGVAECRVVPDLAAAIEELAPGPTVLVDAYLLTGDADVRRALTRRTADLRSVVTVYGRPADTEQGLLCTPHTLSAAATAFKASAQQAARFDAAGDPVELLYRLRGASFRRLYAV